MVQRMLTEMTLGEEERFRLLLITLFSYPSLADRPIWKSLVQASQLTSELYKQTIAIAG